MGRLSNDMGVKQVMNNNDYLFSDAERRFFQEQVNQLNALNAQINSNIRLIMLQRELPGNWRMKGDFSGLETADVQMAPPVSLPPEEDERQVKHVNGVV